MTGTERRDAEQLFHDRQAAERADTFRSGRAELHFDDAAFLDHETWMRPAFARLGDLRGKAVLDYGCGHGMAAVVLARAGATVTAFDLSPGYVNEARARAAANGATITCTVADGERLPFPDGAFDAVWGNAILHHLDLTRAGRELVRVLKPGGVAVFCEPWGGNPLLSFARRFLPYPGKDRTPDEVPLTRRDLRPLRAAFARVELEGFQLFGMVRRLLPARSASTGEGPNSSAARGGPQDANEGVEARPRSRFGRVDALDAHLLRIVPPLKYLCRYVVLTLRAR